MAHTYEVEIKSLLGSEEAAEKLRSGLKKNFPDITLLRQGKQLNHYFNAPTVFSVLAEKVSGFVSAAKRPAFERIVAEGKKISVRTRDTDGIVQLVFKASVGDDTSANGVTRIEFEAAVPKSLEELDCILLEAGCTYQAKWSREREEYQSGDLHVCIDRNAGYGYLAEFEKVTSDEASLGRTRKELLAIMERLQVAELPQDRLERMFAYYNEHWKEYYGTQKTFTVY